MEEAAVLADKIGIMAGKLLLVGSVEELIARHGTYQVHFSTRTEEDVNQAKALMTRLKDSRMMDDVATRFEVNVNDDTTIASIFHVLHEHSGGGQYTVERGNLESIFLKVIREHNISDE
jgi:ATP-binding cassette, subfamily A (ABC1), member 3